MSLINDALKKAQKQREDEAAAASGKVAAPGLGQPVVPPPPPPSVIAPPSAAPEPEPDPMVTARQKRGSQGGMLRNVAVGAIAIVAVVVVVRFTGGDDQSGEPTSGAVSETAVMPASVPSKVESTVAVTAAAPVPRVDDSERVANIAPATSLPSGMSSEVVAGPTQSQPEPEPVVSLPLPAPVSQSEALPVPPPVRTQPAPQPVVNTVMPRESPPAQNVLIAPPSVSSPEPRGPMTPAATGSVTILSQNEGRTTARAVPSSQPTLEPNEAVLNYLERSRVTGVRASPTDPKVLMNDRVFRLNDVVDRDLQLRVIEIDPRQLKFRDPQGYVYTKSF